VGYEYFKISNNRATKVASAEITKPTRVGLKESEPPPASSIPFSPARRVEAKIPAGDGGGVCCIFLIVAGMLGHSLAILMTTYAHYIPGTQDEAARVMDDILIPIPIEPIAQR